MSGGNWKEMLTASEQGDLELVKYHLKMGVNPNYKHPEFLTTPLIESIRFGHLAIAKYLLENGADPNIVEDFSRETALSVAKKTKNKAAISLVGSFLKKNEKMDEPIRNILITGGNRGIGKAIAQKLLEDGHTVVITSRDKSKGDLVAKELAEQTQSSNISCVMGDLSSIQSCYSLCKTIKESHPDINVLINNAGVWMTERKLNADGLELSFMVNYLAPYILCTELLPVLAKNKASRIVNVNAGLYVKGAFDEARTPQGLDFHAIKTYANSKLCGALFTMDFAREIADKGICINAVHPGVINTGLGDSPKLLSKIIKIIKRFWKDPEYGALAPVWLATSKELEGVNGRFYNEKQVWAYPDWVKEATLHDALKMATKKILSQHGDTQVTL